MATDILVTASVQVDASPAVVWDALTNPDMVKKYFFGTDVQTDWIVGSPIVFKGDWEGQQYEDKGTILQLEKYRRLVYEYWSSMSNKEDKPENYSNISYLLTPKDGGTLLEVTQDNVESEAAREHSESNWNSVLNDLKDLVENKGKRM